jgi:hypothetical protein
MLSFSLCVQFRFFVQVSLENNAAEKRYIDTADAAEKRHSMIKYHQIWDTTRIFFESKALQYKFL